VTPVVRGLKGYRQKRTTSKRSGAAFGADDEPGLGKHSVQYGERGGTLCHGRSEEIVYRGDPGVCRVGSGKEEGNWGKKT